MLREQLVLTGVCVGLLVCVWLGIVSVFMLGKLGGEDCFSRLESVAIASPLVGLALLIVYKLFVIWFPGARIVFLS